MQDSTYLARIVAAHRIAASADRRPLDRLIAEASERPPTRSFRTALVSGAVDATDASGGTDTDARGAGGAMTPQGLAVIAEIKRKSPSKGDLAQDLDPLDVAKDYQEGGAACLSVLTDAEFFGGSAEDLVRARESCSIPVLRKDFTVSLADVCDARIMGADCILLIAAALADQELADFLDLSRRLAMDTLVEVHDLAELERALAVGADIVGVNQRDLTTFAVDTARALAMVEEIPAEVVGVAESGIAGESDAKMLADAGYQAILVGETLVKAKDRRAAVRSLKGHRVGTRSITRSEVR